MGQILKRAEVVSEALTWMGTPYHHHGRVRGVGVDCLMLLAEVFQACELVPPVDPGAYPHDWHLHRSDELYLQGLLQHAAELPAGTAPQPGDVGLWRFGRTWSHGGIVVKHEPQVLHAYLGRGVILTRLDEEPLAGRPVRWFTVFKG